MVTAALGEQFDRWPKGSQSRDDVKVSSYLLQLGTLNESRTLALARTHRERTECNYCSVTMAKDRRCGGSDGTLSLAELPKSDVCHGIRKASRRGVLTASVKHADETNREGIQRCDSEERRAAKLPQKIVSRG